MSAGPTGSRLRGLHARGLPPRAAVFVRVYEHVEVAGARGSRARVAVHGQPRSCTYRTRAARGRPGHGVAQGAAREPRAEAVFRRHVVRDRRQRVRVDPVEHRRHRPTRPGRVGGVAPFRYYNRHPYTGCGYLTRLGSCQPMSRMNASTRAFRTSRSMIPMRCSRSANSDSS